MLYAQPVSAQEKRGVIPHAPLLKTAVPDTANQEVAVYETRIRAGRHQSTTLSSGSDHLPHPFRHRRLGRRKASRQSPYMPATVCSFPAGTIHAHWNPSVTGKSPLSRIHRG